MVGRRAAHQLLWGLAHGVSPCQAYAAEIDNLAVMTVFTLCDTCHAIRSESMTCPCRWAWCLPCGFTHIVPYFYVIYFGTLLGETTLSMNMTFLLVMRTLC